MHDTVEDTRATLEDIESEFGVQIVELVEELTDVSKPGEVNRVRRKQIDRRAENIHVRSVEKPGLVCICLTAFYILSAAAERVFTTT